MDQKSRSAIVPSIFSAKLNASIAMQEKTRFEQLNRVAGSADQADVDIDMREVYFLIMKLLSAGPFQRTSEQFLIELLEHHLLPRRYHAWFSRSGAHSGRDEDDGVSLPLSYSKLVERYPHIEKDHLVKLLKQVLLTKAHERIGRDACVLNVANLHAPNAADVPTLLGSGSYSLLSYGSTVDNKQGEPLPTFLRWPHMQADQVRGLSLREIGGGFTKHHRSPSIRSACYAIAKPSMIVKKMQNIKKLRGHRIAVYCAIFDRSGRYVITGSDDRLVKIWSMETAFCLASCRGHEGDITDLAVSSNNVMVASASNDFVIRVWRLADGMPISVLRGHTGAVTAIAFSPRPSSVYQLLSSSDDGTCRIWDARNSQCSPKVYQPKPLDTAAGKSSGLSSNGQSSNMVQSHQILCCAYNANGNVFVTGSSDTLSRVWNACKSNTDDPGQPIHELDVLAGHENDVNYVQFSGCAVPSRPSVSDIFKEDNVPKFKNSWFCHDYIVTCSRDGSAIIWKPRSRRSHGKEGRWIKSYHLKVPPPPLPPQPPRGGPRQRFLPTPRGVNMIVWSLDNRFVLAAIMDCRICVWNAADGSLVHSLTGHSASSYVLDVHPFNPRIAMSAGYDGKTIIWDIWEGVPIQIYEIGRFKLVDGKFSTDGTSIVLSDEVGQIYFLNTGQGEAQKDAKYDQFYLGDYRPLIRDSVGNVLDQETQLPPHRRNVQDLLCDSSMIPYPEPYQSMFQKRRLGALGIEWRPSSIKFAIGPDVSLGQDFEMPLLEDLERMIEPPPEFIDAMYWEPENEVLSDRNDSEYNVAEEYSTDGEPEMLSTSSSDTEGSLEVIDDHSCKVGRRLRRRKHETETKVELVPSSRRRVKKRNFTEYEGSMSRSKRKRKSKSEPKASRGKSNKAKLLRPQRVAARNARNMLSQISETSTEDDGEVDPADDSSSSELLAQDSSSQNADGDGNLEHLHQKYTSQGQLCAGEDELKPCKPVERQPNTEGRKRIVLKFSLRDSKKPEKSEDGKLSLQNATMKIEEREIVSHSVFASPSANGNHLEQFNYETIDSADTRQGARKEDELEESMGSEARKIKSIGSPSNLNREQLEFHNLQEPCHKIIGNSAPTLDVEQKSSLLGCELQPKIFFNHGKESMDTEDKDWPCSSKQTDCGSCQSYPVGEASCSGKLEMNILPKIPKLKIKTPNPITKRNEVPSGRDDHSIASRLRRKVEGSKSKDVTSHRDSSWSETSSSGGSDEAYLEGEALDAMNGNDYGKDLDYFATTRRTRSAKLKIKRILQEPNSFDHKSQRAETLKVKVRTRSGRSRHSNNRHEDSSTLTGRKSNHPLGKLPWLMLAEQEEAFRYIPQLGDIAVYFRQGHEECVTLGRLTGSGPWNSNKGYLSPVEICKVESLAYGNFPGSGEACCKMFLRFIDLSSRLFGETFKLVLPELNGCPDFIVEKTRYDAAINRSWAIRDKCQVWWKSDTGEDDSWWQGRIVSSQAKSTEFPNSPWERYEVEYTDGSRHCHSVWELHDPDYPWEHPHIDSETKNELLHCFTKAVSRNKDRYGIQKLNETAKKADFLNGFPVPLYPELIQARLENDYYRTLEAVEHDIGVMLSNADTYFSKSADLSSKMRRLSNLFTKVLSRLQES